MRKTKTRYEIQAWDGEERRWEEKARCATREEALERFKNLHQWYGATRIVEFREKVIREAI